MTEPLKYWILNFRQQLSLKLPGYNNLGVVSSSNLLYPKSRYSWQYFHLHSSYLHSKIRHSSSSSCTLSEATSCATSPTSPLPTPPPTPALRSISNSTTLAPQNLTQSDLISHTSHPDPQILRHSREPHASSNPLACQAIPPLTLPLSLSPSSSFEFQPSSP